MKEMNKLHSKRLKSESFFMNLSMIKRELKYSLDILQKREFKLLQIKRRSIIVRWVERKL
ncbi:MAG: hypothetical protein RL557_824 [archaeon]|jgi:regulator of PEP synthase PpsR (kinase-PPPase family)